MKRSEFAQHSFLLRCWRIDPASHPDSEEWRFSVEPIDQSIEKQGFTDPDELIEHIRAYIKMQQEEQTSL